MQTELQIPIPPPRSPPRVLSDKREKIQLITFALSAIVYFPFSQWISTTRVGTMFFLWGQMAYLFPLLIAFLAIPFQILGLILEQTRRQSFFWLMLCLLFVISCITGIILGQKVRTAGMRAFAQRSRPLIAAIEQYRRDHSAPPRSLDDLVPDYLPQVPSTGMMAYPEYHYYAGEAKIAYAGNPWALSVATPSGGINFDQILYFPNQNYPATGYGGSLQPIDDWAYVHE
ncbi:MAG TPA: hypothetical protein VHC22_08680 [Pirellulales bacterium]|nr:hypothetical protein [Pirellulales bacterium]